MQVYAAPRGSDKTRTAIDLAIKLDAYLVVHTRDAAIQAFERLGGGERGLRFPITYAELLKSRLHGSFIKKVVIDNMDDFVYHIFKEMGVEPVLATVDSDFVNHQQIEDIVNRKGNGKPRSKNELSVDFDLKVEKWTQN